MTDDALIAAIAAFIRTHRQAGLASRTMQMDVLANFPTASAVDFAHALTVANRAERAANPFEQTPKGPQVGISGCGPQDRVGAFGTVAKYRSCGADATPTSTTIEEG